jgi:DNA polymerase III delta prime subunit
MSIEISDPTSIMPSDHSHVPLFIQRYKPHSIDDFFASYKLKSVLRTLLDIDDLNILFIGNACSGKTILLYTMIHEYYHIEPGQPIPENNILYINNLKEQGVEYFRNDLKTFSQSHSMVFGKKKMVIIDDIDTIPEQNQHVLRNYMDKYRHNVHFISVCSNIQKVIESIQSRVHIIRIEPSNREQMEELYHNIAVKENLSIDPKGKEVLLSYCRHSIRALINHMEKIWILDTPSILPADESIGGSAASLRIANASNAQGRSKIVQGWDLRSPTGETTKESRRSFGVSLEPDSALGYRFTEEDCRKICSDISFQQLELYIRQLHSHDISSAIHNLFSLYDYGFSVIDIIESMFHFVKYTPLLSEECKYRSIPIFCKYITIFYGIHEDAIELALFTNELYHILLP